ncbi:hypothetical protein Q5752_005236 [Cryptotrichosporon argae]
MTIPDLVSPRRVASGSRNDLFNTSWKPEVPPPRPLDKVCAAVAGGVLGRGWSSDLGASTAASSSTTPFTASAPLGSGPSCRRDSTTIDGLPFRRSPSARTARLPSVPTDADGLVPPQTPITRARTPPATATDSPKTSSFFDVSAPSLTPPPAPRLPPALRDSGSLHCSPLDLSRASSMTKTRENRDAAAAESSTSTSPLASRAPSSSRRAPPPTPLDRLGPLHQPSSVPTRSWDLPLPPRSDDVQLRLSPEPTYLLGEGRFARVYLGAYRRRAIDSAAAGAVVPPDTRWTLCAVKRMTPDRDSQAQGLREAFILNRLKGGRGSVHIIKLIAVKEDADDVRAPGAHGRSASDATREAGVARRLRSSTVYAGHLGDAREREREANRAHADAHAQLGSFPSLPALASAAAANGYAHAHAYDASTPSLSRLVLVLEHAPLGTLDRLLRTSPGLVGRDLWDRWAREGTEAVVWVHSKGIVHADIKPGNLLLTTDLHLRLSDFGSSLLVHPAHPPTDGVGLGTLPFSAPELVDPARPFAFGADVFALGATLYQCLTGREPYRGLRPVEVMHHVRKGELWDYEERARLERIGSGSAYAFGSGTTAALSPAGMLSNGSASPFPSAWREVTVRRGGSLRVPGEDRRDRGVAGAGAAPAAEADSAQLALRVDRPRLVHRASAESVKASDDAHASGDSPAAVRMWANWVKTSPARRPGGDAISRLLADDGAAAQTESSASTSAGADSASLRPSFATHNINLLAEADTEPPLTPSPVPDAPAVPLVPDPADSADPADADPEQPRDLAKPYADGSPAMLFLDGSARVPDAYRDVVRGMLRTSPDARLTAQDVLARWDAMRVGVEG